MDKSNEKKKILTIIRIVMVVGLAVFLGISWYLQSQKNKIPDLSFEEALQYTTKNDSDAVITIGIIRDGTASYKVYGENGRELPHEAHFYEIGSLTKTFTAALVRQAIEKGKLDIDDAIDKYLDVPAGKDYPTIRELVTHTSGYREHYFEFPMIMNHLKGGNDFCGITKDMILKKAGKKQQNKGVYGFTYSNFGYAVLGLVLEKVYGTDMTVLLNSFAEDQLSLKNTCISDSTGDLGKYWQWKEGDAYLPAGGLVSDIEDMLSYAGIQLKDDDVFSYCHLPLREIGATPAEYDALGVRMDEIGMSWVIDDRNGIIWHNGGTGHYNCYMGFIPEKDIAVVVLSNLSPNRRIPATVLGAKLLLELSGS